MCNVHEPISGDVLKYYFKRKLCLIGIMCINVGASISGDILPTAHFFFLLIGVHFQRKTNFTEIQVVCKTLAKSSESQCKVCGKSHNCLGPWKIIELFIVIFFTEQGGEWFCEMCNTSKLITPAVFWLLRFVGGRERGKYREQLCVIRKLYVCYVCYPKIVRMYMCYVCYPKIIRMRRARKIARGRFWSKSPGISNH